MLIALRAILLVLFIAAPFGEPRTAADPYRVPAEFAADAVLSCPDIEPGQRAGEPWTAGKRGFVRPGAVGDA
jgi:hypothetical protein